MFRSAVVAVGSKRTAFVRPAARRGCCWKSTSTVKPSKNEEEEENTTDKKEDVVPAGVGIAPPIPVYNHKLTKTPLTGLGQVIFLNSSKCGGILLGSLAIGNPYLATFAALGTAASTLTAKQLQLDKDATKNGLLSYNGALVGCATAVFLVPHQPAGETSMGILTTLSTVSSAAAVTGLGAAASTALTASLGNHYFTQQPQWTYAFNLVTLSMMLQTTSSKTAEAVAVVAEETIVPVPSLWDVTIGGPLHGLSQIFVVENTFTGLGVLAAIATYSPQLAGHALMGSVVGSATGYWCLGGASSPADVAAGLWGYNAALSSMAVAVFGVSSSSNNNNNNTSLNVLSASAAVTSTVLFGALSPHMPVPCLTLPFCLTMSAVYPLLLNQVVPAVSLAANPHSPEVNRASAVVDDDDDDDVKE